MKKILAGLMVFGFLFIGSQVQASTLSDLKAEILSLKEEILSLRSSMMGAVSNAVTKTTDLTPRISYWPGKVNQHVDIGLSAWSTDSDGTSSASINKLTYCKKWYPNTISTEFYKMENINTWKTSGNVGSYSAYVPSYKCVQSSSSQTSASNPTSANAPKPNLTISLSNVPSSLKPDTFFKVTTTVKNSGGAPAISSPIGSTVRVTLSPGAIAQSSTDTIPSGSSSIEVNGTATYSNHSLRAADLKSTTYFYIEACADVNNYIDESDENDNCTRTGQIKVDIGSTPINGKWSAWANQGSCVNGKQIQTRYCVGALNGGTCPSDAEGSIISKSISCQAASLKPDLVSSISYVPDVYVGNSFSIGGIIKNIGNVATKTDVNSPINAELQFSRTPYFDLVNGKELSYANLPDPNSQKQLVDFPQYYKPIPANGFISFSYKVESSSYSNYLKTPGTFYFRICADLPRDELEELNEGNNCSPVSSVVVKQGQTVDSLPDLVVTNLIVPSKVKVNTTTYFTAVVKNIGTAPVMSAFNNRFNIYTSQGSGQGETAIDVPSGKDIKPGASIYIYAKHKFTKEGKVGIMVCADHASGGYGNEIWEPTSNPNCSTYKEFNVGL